ncbi:MAG: BrnA antitoxin family protein [Pseudoxanthomonas sp.]
MAKKIDPEMTEFQEALLRSVEQAVSGQYAAVHTPPQIRARRGRPSGSVKANRKEQINLRLSQDVLAVLRATGPGWQTRVDTILRERFAL